MHGTKRRVLAAGAAVVMAATLAACGEDEPADNTATPTADGTTPTDGETTGGGDGAGGTVGVILPDTESSARWETADRPFLQAAFEEAGIEANIQNAQGDAAQMQTIAEAMITEGVDVLIIVNLDSESGAQIHQRANEAGIPVIDYDRLTLNGSADYYVSFDNVAVGRLQGEGLVQCLEDEGVENPRIVELNGSPTDNNATLFEQGSDEVLDPLYEEGWEKVDDQPVPDWDNAEAARIFEQIYTAAGGDVDGVLAANDGLGLAAAGIVANDGRQIPITGQDATVDGLRAILTGDMCMTVYKAVRAEAEGAAQAAIAIINGEEVDTGGATTTDSESGREVPSILLEPVAIFRDNVGDVIDDGYVERDEVCAGEVADVCEELGL